MTYILLHGAWHASWCWRDIAPALIQQGHTVSTPDLPGHGNNPMPFADITLKTYVGHVMTIIDATQRPVILVGHSMAGAVISQIAEIIPEKISLLIYINAFMPANQSSILEEAKKSAEPGIGTEMIIDKVNNRIQLKMSPRLIDFFYGDCRTEDANYALSQLTPEPNLPFTDKLILSDQKFGFVKKRYITCSRDKVILPEDQRRMYQGLIKDIVKIEADHSPFFSAPSALIKALLCV